MQTISRSKGFTIIEILVVVTIVAVLSAISFTVFGRVRESGRNAMCQSNLRQIQMALQSYVQDNDGKFVRGYNQTTLQLTWGDELLPYIKSQSVFRCPSANRAYPPSPQLDFSDYALIFPAVNNLTSNLHYDPKHESQVSNPSLVCVFMDFDMTLEGNHVNNIYFTSSCGVSGNYNIRHSGGANYAFLDGHVKWLTPPQAGTVECNSHTQ